MAPKKDTNQTGEKPKRKRKMPPKDTPEYVDKREKNNIAVKKSRDRSKQKAQETMDKMQKLKDSNEELEQQATILAKELSVLKDLFVMVHQDRHNSMESDNNMDSDHQGMIDEIKETVKKEVLEEGHSDNHQTRECNVVMKRRKKEQTIEHNNVVNTKALANDHEYV